MPERFDLFRFSLLPRPQMDILHHPDPTREAYLRQLFSARHEFTHYKTVFHYVPSDTPAGETAIIGRIGRSVVMEENLSPDVGLADSEHETWKASFIIIDPTEHEDGQKVSFESDPLVGKTDAIMQSLVHALNEKNPLTAFHLEVAPISEASTFWQFAAENKGNITMLSFLFVAPNMFGGIDNITEEMRLFRDEEKAQRVKIQLQSDEGIETDTDKIKNSVEYTTRGGGDIAARARGGRSYNSKEKTRHVTMDKVENSEPLLDRIARSISKVLGRE